MIKIQDTTAGRCHRALNYIQSLYKETPPWLVLGGHSFQWPDEQAPLLASPNVSQIDDALLAFKVHWTRLVYKSAGGSIKYGDDLYDYVKSETVEEAIRYNATSVLISIGLRVRDLSYSSRQFRVLGLTNSINFKPFTDITQAYVPMESVDSYELDTIITSEPIILSTSDTHVIAIIKEF
jgi:hypothetical protein